jgi:hypothetical protein
MAMAESDGCREIDGTYEDEARSHSQAAPGTGPASGGETEEQLSGTDEQVAACHPVALTHRACRLPPRFRSGYTFRVLHASPLPDAREGKRLLKKSGWPAGARDGRARPMPGGATPTADTNGCGLRRYGSDLGYGASEASDGHRQAGLIWHAKGQVLRVVGRTLYSASSERTCQVVKPSARLI